MKINEKFNKISESFVENFIKEKDKNYFLTRHDIRISLIDDIKPYKYHYDGYSEPVVLTKRKWSGSYYECPISKIEIINKDVFDKQLNTPRVQRKELPQQVVHSHTSYHSLDWCGIVDFGNRSYY